VAVVAAILNTVPISAEHSGDDFCATGCAFRLLLFVFCVFVGIKILLGRVNFLDLTRTLPVGLFPIVGSTMSHAWPKQLNA
jgi:hypothetical protein